MVRETWTDERLDDLRGRVDDGFRQVDERFDRLETRVETGFDRVDRRFDRFDEKFDRLGGRLDRLQQIMLGVAGTMIATLIVTLVTQH